MFLSCLTQRTVLLCNGTTQNELTATKGLLIYLTCYKKTEDRTLMSLFRVSACTVVAGNTDELAITELGLKQPFRLKVNLNCRFAIQLHAPTNENKIEMFYPRL